MHDLDRRIYQAFSPEPLTADQQDLYVDLDDVRGDADVVNRLDRTVRFAEEPTCQVLAGHKGSGKTTELLRLQQRLQTADTDDRYFVVFCSADDDIDRNDVDFPDVLIAIIRQMAAQLHERADIELKPGYFKDRWARLKDLLFSEVDFDNISIEAGMATISMAIKNSPDTRQRIREALEPDAANWLSAANDVIGEAVLKLKEYYAGLVVIIDDLDKMVVRYHPVGGCMTDEHLFVNRAVQLSGLQCHLIYTIPLTLAYSHLSTSVAANFGGQVPVVPMVKVATAPPESAPYEPGIAKMRQMIDLRMNHAEIRGSQVFASDAECEELIRLSGGQPSEMMNLVRRAVVAGDLPIDRAAVHRARVEGERGYSMTLLRHHWDLIDEVRRTSVIDRGRESDSAFHELLRSRAILQYVNEKEWYALNPMVAGLSRPGDDG